MIIKQDIAENILDYPKHCPCCGHEAKWRKEWIGNVSPTEYWYILCVNEKCHLRTPGYQKEYRQKALEIWNNRM